MLSVLGLLVFLDPQGNIVHSGVIDSFPSVEACHKVMTERWEHVRQIAPPPQGIRAKLICFDVDVKPETDS